MTKLPAKCPGCGSYITAIYTAPLTKCPYCGKSSQTAEMLSAFSEEYIASDLGSFNGDILQKISDSVDRLEKKLDTISIKAHGAHSAHPDSENDEEYHSPMYDDSDIDDEFTEDDAEEYDFEDKKSKKAKPRKEDEFEWTDQIKKNYDDNIDAGTINDYVMEDLRMVLEHSAIIENNNPAQENDMLISFDPFEHYDDILIKYCGYTIPRSFAEKEYYLDENVKFVGKERTYEWYELPLMLLEHLNKEELESLEKYLGATDDPEYYFDWTKLHDKDYLMIHASRFDNKYREWRRIYKPSDYLYKIELIDDGYYEHKERYLYSKEGYYNSFPVDARFAKGQKIKITISGKVGIITKEMFASPENITQICLEEGIKEINFATFEDSKDLTEIHLPDTLQLINSGAFKGCTSLMTVYNSNAVKSIGKQAFEDCSSLSWFHLSPLVRLREFAFYNCTALYKVYSSSKNDSEYYNDVPVHPKRVMKLSDIIDFSKDKTSPLDVSGSAGEDLDFLEYPDDYLPFDIKDYPRIPLGCFQNCESLKIVTIPDGTVSVEAQAFAGCSSLERVNIPDSVAVIDKAAFYDCPKVKPAFMLEDHTYPPVKEPEYDAPDEDNLELMRLNNDD